MSAASSAYTRAHNTYWAAPHDERAHRTCQETVARLDTALTALLAYLYTAPHRDAEQERAAPLHATLRKEVTLIQERVQQEQRAVQSG